MHRLVEAAVALMFMLGLASTAPAQVSASLAQKSPGAAEIMATAERSGRARIIVMYQTPPGPARANIGTAAEDIQAITNENYAAQDAIVGAVFGSPSNLNDPAHGFKRMPITPAFAINATAAEINALAEDPRVTTIEPDGIGWPRLIQSVPLIGMANAYAAGATGNGQAVAVLDTGVETTHKFLAGQTIQEACFSTTQGTLGAGGSASLCPGGAASATGPGTAANCPIAWDG